MQQLSTFVIEDAWVVYDRTPAMFPGLTYTTNGVLLASFSTVPDGLPGGEIQVIRSYDHGHTWSRPLVVARAQRTQGAALNAVGLTALRDGTLLLPFNDVLTSPGFLSRNATLQILRSTDNGWSWEATETPFADILEPFTYGACVERSDGEILCPIWGRWKEDERWRSALICSSDRGKHWRLGATIAYDPEARLPGAYAQSAVNGFSDGAFDPSAIAQPTFRPHSAVDGFTETSIITLNDGRLLAILRQQGVEGQAELFFYQSLSEDGGASWSPYRRTNLCGMSPCLHYTPGGQLLLAYRRCAPDGVPGSQPGLSIATSCDNGATWDERLTLTEPKGTQYTGEYQVGYPAIVNTPDGNILIIYYSYDEALPHRRYLAANLLREQR